MPVADPVSGDVVQPGSNRLLPLEGGRNFRDMGGYRTVDGHQVRWGMLFRSGAMSGLTEADYAYLNSLGIRSVRDLRHASERQSAPTVWTGGHDYWTGDLGELGDLRTIVAIDGERTPDTIRGAMIVLYRRLPAVHKMAYAQIFQELVAGRVPLAFNCTAGKDRTGVVAALILTALGVPRETVVEDYLLTNDVVDLLALLSTHKLADMPRELAVPIALADKAYIDALFDTLDRQYGSVEGYLREELGTGPAELQAMRAHLLT
jgi:protein-tyrosine phosphatase